MVKEVITLQLGGFANYVGSHFWNLQDEFGGRDGGGGGAIVSGMGVAGSAVHKGVDLNVLMRCSASETWTPRLVAVDLKGCLGPLSLDYGGGVSSRANASANTQLDLAGSCPPTWSGGTAVCARESVRRSRFLQWLETEDDVDDDHGDDGDNDEGRGGGGGWMEERSQREALPLHHGASSRDQSSGWSSRGRRSGSSGGQQQLNGGGAGRSKGEEAEEEEEMARVVQDLEEGSGHWTQFLKVQLHARSVVQCGGAGVGAWWDERVWLPPSSQSPSATLAGGSPGGSDAGGPAGGRAVGEDSGLGLGNGGERRGGHAKEGQEELEGAECPAVASFWAGREVLGCGGGGSGVGEYGHGSGLEEVEERVRYFAEDCDHMQGFQLLCNDYDAFAGAAGQAVLPLLSDEYPKQPRVVLALRPPSLLLAHLLTGERGIGRPPQGEEEVEDPVRLLTRAAGLASFVGGAHLCLPMGLPRLEGHFPCMSPRDAYAFDSSAVYAAAADTATLPWRLAPPSASASTAAAARYGMGAGGAGMHMNMNMSMAETVALHSSAVAAGGSGAVAAVRMAMPPLASTSPQQPFYLDEAGYGEVGLTGGSRWGHQAASVAAAESVVLRGSPLPSALLVHGGAPTDHRMRQHSTQQQQRQRRPLVHQRQHLCVVADPLPIPLPFPRFFNLASSGLGSTSNQGRGGQNQQQQQRWLRLLQRSDVESCAVLTRMQSGSPSLLPLLSRSADVLQQTAAAAGSSAAATTAGARGGSSGSGSSQVRSRLRAEMRRWGVDRSDVEELAETLHSVVQNTSEVAEAASSAAGIAM